MKRTALSIVLLFYTVSGFAQVKTDAQSIFKMLIFLDRENSNFRGMDKMVFKNDSLYKEFSSVLYIKLDTLKIIRDELSFGQPGVQYNFYQLMIYDVTKREFAHNYSYKRKLSSDEEQFLGIFSGRGDSYIIAINKATGRSFRLRGFNSNDFLSFLADVKETYNGIFGHKPLSTKAFFKNLQVENLDFECLYEGLSKKGINRNEYPCLLRISDPIIIR